ncbi:MAG: hypothetical protein V7706_02455 [Dietzia psychralcaliphila]
MATLAPPAPARVVCFDEAVDTTHVTPLLLTTLSAFQAGLAAGAPWGRVSFGGTHPGVLPPRLRVVSGIASPVYLAAALALLSERTPPRARDLVSRACVGVGTAGTVVNALSPSPPERVWSVFSLALATASWRDVRRERRAR